MTLADAIISNNIEVVKSQLKQISDLNFFDEYGFTPLIEAILMQKSEIAYLLLDNSADPNFKDSTGRTPLHWAVEINDIGLCEKLLDNKADPNQFSITSQPILTYPLLRKQKQLIDLLVKHDAKIDFAKNFINVKLLGHCFELSGQTYIVSINNKFILVDFEGFYLEASLSMIKDSLARFLNNFSAKDLHSYFNNIEVILEALSDAETLSRLQHFTVNIEDHHAVLDEIFSKELIILPGIYQGHAITFIFYKEFFAKCDRGANSKLEGTSVIYRITSEIDKKQIFSKIVFQKNNDKFMHSDVNKIMGLETLLTLPIPPQITGNCSWANVEAVIPTLYFLIEFSNYQTKDVNNIIEKSLGIFNRWREWNKDRALNECIQRFNRSPDNQKAVLASLLGSILINIVSDSDAQNMKRIESIMRVLSTKDFYYVINSYRNIFHTKHHTKIGQYLEKYYKKY
jgi:hypothetical protein